MLKAFFELNGDILIETEDQETGIIIEIKYAETGNLEAVSEEALKQIEDRRYEEQLLEEGVEHILKYGIAFYKKKCRVMTVKSMKNKYTKAAEPLRDVIQWFCFLLSVLMKLLNVTGILRFRKV